MAKGKNSKTAGKTTKAAEARKPSKTLKADKPKKHLPKWLKATFRIIGRIIWPRFIRNSFHELKLVTWPSWRTGRQLTLAVIIFAVIFAVLVALVDWGLNSAFKSLFLR